MNRGCSVPEEHPGSGEIEVVDASKAHVRIVVADDQDADRIEAVLGALGYEVSREGDDGLGEVPPGLQRLVDRLARRHKLTEREAAVLRLILRGDEIDAMAAELGLRTATVRWCEHNVRTKTGAHSREALLRLALFGRPLPTRPRNPS